MQQAVKPKKARAWHPVMLLATGWGTGYSPVASGTVGSIWGIVIVVALFPFLSVYGQIALGVVLSLLAVPICGYAEKQFRKKDDGRIVADEYMTYPLCMIGIPVSLGYWWMVPIAFVTCRLFDIIKPPPAYQAQQLKGGLGIVVDDVVASLYSLLCNHLIFRGMLFFFLDSGH
jgi:phosphatidylglycerophosphatase A